MTVTPDTRVRERLLVQARGFFRDAAEVGARVWGSFRGSTPRTSPPPKIHLFWHFGLSQHRYRCSLYLFTAPGGYGIQLATLSVGDTLYHAPWYDKTALPPRFVRDLTEPSERTQRDACATRESGRRQRVNLTSILVFPVERRFRHEPSFRGPG